MKKSLKKVLSGAASAVMLTSGAAQAVVAEQAVQIAPAEEAAVAYDKVANVQGDFSFNQNTVTPADEVFSIMGTAVTGICAKPEFALSSIDKDYYVNVGGKISYSYTRDLKSLAPKTRTLLCACATSAATVNAAVTGVALSDVIELSKIDPDVNALIVKSSDGYSATFSLKMALDKEAMLVYQVGDQAIASGAQLWMPDAVAKYFVRSVAELEIAKLDEIPELDKRAEEYQAEIVIKNQVEGKEFAAGKPITFQGYADDVGEAIEAVEFSMDGGETWTTCATEKASSAVWVSWSFAYTPAKAGNYELLARARTTSGKVSALASSVAFSVVE